MRYIVLIKGTKATEAAEKPTLEEMGAMEAFNELLASNGVTMLDGAGLRPTSQGVRIRYANGNATITDGPFTESKELVAGYCLLEAPSKEQLVELFKKAPFTRGEEVEIRELFLYTPEDFATQTA